MSVRACPLSALRKAALAKPQVRHFRLNGYHFAPWHRTLITRDLLQFQGSSPAKAQMRGANPENRAIPPSMQKAPFSR